MALSLIIIFSSRYTWSIEIVGSKSNFPECSSWNQPIFPRVQFIKYKSTAENNTFSWTYQTTDCTTQKINPILKNITPLEKTEATEIFLRQEWESFYKAEISTLKTKPEVKRNCETLNSNSSLHSKILCVGVRCAKVENKEKARFPELFLTTENLADWWKLASKLPHWVAERFKLLLKNSVVLDSNLQESSQVVHTELCDVPQVLNEKRFSRKTRPTERVCFHANRKIRWHGVRFLWSSSIWKKQEVKPLRSTWLPYFLSRDGSLSRNRIKIENAGLLCCTWRRHVPPKLNTC